MLGLRAAQLTNKLSLAYVHTDNSIDSYSIHVTFSTISNTRFGIARYFAEINNMPRAFSNFLLSLLQK